jgi:predicted O-methyltransferase YrrM
VKRHPVDGGIHGYTYAAQLQWLKDKARQKWRILELGAYLGRTTDALARATQGVVHVVDHWRGSTDKTDECPSGPEVREEFLENVKGLRNVTVWCGESSEMWRKMGHLRFDMVWIDADHSYEKVREDIRLWSCYLDKDGLLCGHDAEYPGVSRAINELVPGHQIFKHQESCIWFRGA